MNKVLLLCRHAKSSWKDPALPDMARPLNKRGKRDVLLMGDQLKQRGLGLDGIVTSPAKRARKTARNLAKRIEFPRKKIVVLDVLYFGSEEEILYSLQHIPDACNRVLVVGHNPMITGLANNLGGLHIDNVPTCGIVALEFPIASWQGIGTHRGAMLFFDVPKGLRRDDR